jgi:HPt (histidine-containing phosphotransfer) domain-containing protein
VIDPAAIARLKRIGGDGLVREMLTLFLQHAPGRVATAEEAVAAGTLRAAEHAAHSLKSSAGNVGATRLQAAAAAVEAATESSATESSAAESPPTPSLPESLAASLLQALRAEYQAAARELTAVLASLDA